LDTFAIVLANAANTLLEWSTDDEPDEAALSPVSAAFDAAASADESGESAVRGATLSRA
jgi:hypothetical protein